MDEILKLKADAYDISIEIDNLNQQIQELQKKKQEIVLKIQATSTKKIKVEQTEDLKAKEARIMAKRLKKIREVRADEPVEPLVISKEE